MSGRAALIVVVGFAFIFGYLNLNMSRLSTRAVENMVGYSAITTSRNVANAGINVGLAIMFLDTSHRGIIAQQSFSKVPFNGCSYTVTYNPKAGRPDTFLLTSVSNCPTNFQTITGSQFIISDTVIVEMEKILSIPFSYWGWLSNNENNTYFITGDSIFGKVHSNGNFYINGTPYFDQLVTTSGTFSPAISTKKNPTSNKAYFNGGEETNVAKIDFPTDITALKTNATNNNTRGWDSYEQTEELWVNLINPSSSNNDGYAIISKNGFMGSGGTKVDSIKLSGTTDNVIYSSHDIHVKGVLDGRLSIASGDDVYIEGNLTYEVSPKTNINTTDMLGLVANSDVIISSAVPMSGVNINGSIFALNGSFTAANKNNNPADPDGYINIVGSVTQNTRGGVGTFNQSTGHLTTGYMKNYKFDDRLNDPYKSPPSFPGSGKKHFEIVNWWESTRQPQYF